MKLFILLLEKEKELPILYILDEFYNYMDEKLIYGAKCTSCNKVFFPPKSVCPQCSNKMKNLIQLPSTGIIKNFTEGKKGSKKKEIYGLIQIDHCDTPIIMRILNANRKKLKNGMAVKVVWGNGHKVDTPHIIGFEPIK